MADKPTTQDGRLLKIETLLGKDYLLIEKLSVDEEISDLFTLDVEISRKEGKANDPPAKIDTSKIIGQTVTISITEQEDSARFFNGIVTELYWGERSNEFTHYQIKVRPAVWSLTQVHQSRIFQQKSVVEILEELLKPFPFEKKLKETYEKREYCVQYRESDFDFISRLMEEEGIFYYFEHTEDSHKIIICDNPLSHIPCPKKSEIPYFWNFEGEGFVSKINKWEFGAQYQTGMVTFWDHNFELPKKKLDATLTSVWGVASNQKLEFYDYPAGYGRKYDGISSGGGDQAGNLQKIFDDNKRTARVAMEGLDSRMRRGLGESDCCSMTAGHKFTLKNHPTKEENGEWAIVSISHYAVQNPDYLHDNPVEFPYSNIFEGIPLGSQTTPFRPLQKTAKPVVRGCQTAYVVGPDGEEIYTDKYGRVKVQFHWDRDGKNDAKSSCWVRVAQTWASKKWGSIYIPRIGMEVLVDFLEGDPDQPIITGCVYNADAMPPYDLPDNKTRSTIKTNSTKGGDGFNEFRFEDLKGSEQIFIHGEKDLDVRIKNDERHWVKADHHFIVKGNSRELIEGKEHRTVNGDQMTALKSDMHLKVSGKDATEIGGSLSLKVGGAVAEDFGADHSEKASGSIYLKAGATIVLEAGAGITLKVGGSFVTVNSGGVQISGPIVLINSGGAALSGSPGSIVPPTAPDAPDPADDDKPGTKIDLEKKSTERKEPTFKPLPIDKSGDKTKDKVPTHWIEIVLVDEDGQPVPGEHYKITMPDGSVKTGSLDEKGKARVEGIKDPGSCKVTFPKRDGRSWEKT